MKITEKTKYYIERAVKVHGNTYDYSKTNFIDGKTKVIIICKTHGEFQMLPYMHIYGQKSGCKKCAIIRISAERTGNTEDFIRKAKGDPGQHGETYDYSKTNYVDCNTNVIIICRIHGEFLQLPRSHLKGSGCRLCGEISRISKRKGNTEKFIIDAKEIHGETFDYSKTIYEYCNTNVIIICKIHGEFSQTPESHLKGHGCIDCYNDRQRSNTAEFIKKSEEIHGIGTYDYSKTNYINADTKVIIICKIHGEFEQRPSNHLNGSGCIRCNIENQRKSLDQFIKESIEIHGETYIYSKANYKTNHDNLIITCRKHGDFEKTPIEHIYKKSGCPKCLLCPSCELWKTNGKLCSYCKPKSENQKYKKTKEYAVVNHLREHLPADKEFIHNRSVGKDCTEGHLFPDIRFDCEFYHLIVEVDEHKHRGAGYQCDERRMYDIIAKLGMPCIFIRYNPDNKNSDKNELLKLVEKYLEIKIDKPIWNEHGFHVEYLYYD